MSGEAKPAMRNIERLLRPRSIAVVGASPTRGSLGASVIENLDRGNFKGSVFLINPKREEIGRRPCLKSVDDLPVGVDVAVLAIPQAGVLEAIRALARRQVGAAIIFSAGFAEAGEHGQREQREIIRLATESGMLIEGPNCLGFVNYVDGIALTFVLTPVVAHAGRPAISIVSQSGAMAAVVGVSLMSRNLDISYSVSTGNEAVSGVEDYVEYLLDDPMTRVIGLIVEQFRQPARFLELARRARSLSKYIVLLHPGRSAAARASAATHTGALAGDFQMMRTQVERQGVLLAGSLEEYADVLELAARCSKPPAAGTIVVTESGAFKALTLDLCEQIGLDLPELNDDSSPELRAAVPAFVGLTNPLDLTAQGLIDPDIYRRALQASLSDPRFGTVVFGIIQTDHATCDIKFPPIIAAVRDLAPQKIVILAGLDDGASVPPQYIQQLRDEGVPYFPTPDRAFRAVARFLELTQRAPDSPMTTVSKVGQKLPESGVIAEYRSKELLGGLGIPLPRGRFVTTLEQALEVAPDVGYPVVLKAQSAELSHKSDAGGVVLGLNDARALATGWNRLHSNIAHHRPGLSLDGVLIEQMGRPGTELIIGARNDPNWGAAILIGMGGVQAEVLRDTRLIPSDLPIDGIIRELHLLKGGALLRGFRGSPTLDVAAVANIISRIGALLRGEPSIREIDLNPVIVYAQGDGAIALDALMLVERGE